MKIIYNNKLECHHQKILSLLEQSTELFITSPFLSEDFCTLIESERLKKIKKLTLITTLCPNTRDQIKKVYSLFSLITSYPYKKNLSIYIDNKLHAKVYIFKKGERYLNGIITSANFTFSGMNTNHEIGVELKTKNILKYLEDLLKTSYSVELFDNEKINIIKLEVDNYLSKYKKPMEDKIKLDLSKYLKKNSNSSTINYWLKPIGVTDEPILSDVLFNDKKLELYFSKRKPSGVNVDDILIAYGVGSTKILSIYKVISEPKYADLQQLKEKPWIERWPWYVLGENISRNYGSIWASKDLKLHSLVDAFKIIDPLGILTLRGGTSLGALNYHIDKINLRREFAEYIIGRVMQFN